MFTVNEISHQWELDDILEAMGARLLSTDEFDNDSTISKWVTPFGFLIVEYNNKTGFKLYQVNKIDF